MSSLKKMTLAAGALALAAVMAPRAQAQDLETREVMVTATRTEKELMEVPMSVGVVTAEDLKREPSASVADALSSIPGVTVADGGMPGGKRVMIRGESPMRSLILIDGVKVSEQKSMSGSAILIDTSEIERIEVIKGPASVLYGSEAIGGVVNIITKKGGEKPISFSQNFTLDSSTGSANIHTAIFGSYNGFNYRFSGSGVNAGKRQTPGGSLEDSEYKNRYYSGQVGYDWDKGSVYLRADRYESEIHIPSNVASGKAWAETATMSGWMNNNTTVSLYLPQWDRESLTGGFEFRDLTDNLKRVKVDGYFQNMKKDFRNNVNVYNDLFVDLSNMPGNISSGLLQVIVDQNIHTYNDQDSYGGSAQTEWEFGSHSVIAGLDYNKDNLKADDKRVNGSVTTSTPDLTPNTGFPPFPPFFEGPNHFRPVVTPSASAYYQYEVEQSTIGLFIQDEWDITNDWTAILGLRETWIDSSLKRNNNPALPNNKDISDSNLVGNVGVIYSGFEDMAIRAHWSQGYRFPSLNQMYLGTVHGQEGRTLPNPDLKPEESDNFEIGLRYNGGDWNLDMAVFYSDSKNYITTQTIGGTKDSQFVNMDKARTYGVELGLDYTFEEYGLTPYVSAAWINRRIENTIEAGRVVDVNGTNTKVASRLSYKTDDAGYSPFQGRVGLKWQGDAPTGHTVYSDLYVKWASRSKEYSYDNSYGHDYNGDFNFGFITEEKGGWATLNLALGTEWGDDHKWNASIALMNITDKKYTQADSAIVDPGFHVVAGVGFEY
ncbi:hypothetical protein C4J81_01915 [Deltaproteobacteria bacterium Smac51]|nr:hypothetical protein C4J81_01915 [Deltaproteobacteria bacterium Smac51]